MTHSLEGKNRRVVPNMVKLGTIITLAGIHGFTLMLIMKGIL